MMKFLKKYGSFTIANLSRNVLICCVLIVFGSCYKTRTGETEIGSIGTTQEIRTGWHKVIVKIDLAGDKMDICGICFSDKTQMPTINDKTAVLDENGCVNLDNLEDATTYFWRTFIKKGDAVAYSETQSFKTLQYPLVAMNPIDSTCNTVTFSLTVAGNTGYTYKETGIFTTAKNDCLDGKEFTMTIGLDEFNKNYSTSAYIKNSIDEVAHGGTVNFTTKPRRYPSVVTQPAIMEDSVRYFVGEISDDGCPSYTEKGLCFSIYEKIENGSEKTLVPGVGIVTFYATAPSWFGTGHYYSAYAKQLDTIIYGHPKRFTP